MISSMIFYKMLLGFKFCVGFFSNMFKFLGLIIIGTVALFFFLLVAIFDKAYYKSGFDKIV